MREKFLLWSARISSVTFHELKIANFTERFRVRDLSPDCSFPPLSSKELISGSRFEFPGIRFQFIFWSGFSQLSSTCFQLCGQPSPDKELPFFRGETKRFWKSRWTRWKTSRSKRARYFIFSNKISRRRQSSDNPDVRYLTSAELQTIQVSWWKREPVLSTPLRS